MKTGDHENQNSSKGLFAIFDPEISEEKLISSALLMGT